MASSSQKDLLSSVISDIKSYNGDDPLRPWIRGIRRIHQSLPSHVLSEKLPRFLQKCAQTFESDRRYRNDSRYLAVWIQLMDYVDDAGVLLRKIEKSQIGVKQTKFYIAYALYYEKKKRFEDAEKMYQLGVQKIAEPMGELQKSYDQFLHRMKLLKRRRARREVMANIGETMTSGHSRKISASIDLNNHQNAENFLQTDSRKEKSGFTVGKSLARSQSIPINDLEKSPPLHRDGVGLLQIDDSCHQGLSDPTIYPKETMNAISSMLKDAVLPETTFNHVKQTTNQRRNTIELVVNEEMEESGAGNHRIISNSKTVSTNLVNSDSPKRNHKTELQNPFVGAFKILADEEDDENCDDDAHQDYVEGEEPMEGSCQLAWPTSHTSTETRINNFDVRLKEDTVFRRQKEDTVFRRLKEDTVIRKIVGSTVFDEPKVENACHHGLVDPTVNLKQAIDDINGMFGKPLNFVKVRKPKKEHISNRKSVSSKNAFFILADENTEKDLNCEALPCISSSSNREIDLFEPTIFTKEAMNEINDLFGKPLNF